MFLITHTRVVRGCRIAKDQTIHLVDSGSTLCGLRGSERRMKEYEWFGLKEITKLEAVRKVNCKGCKKRLESQK
jgi:hypothetical protein